MQTAVSTMLTADLRIFRIPQSNQKSKKVDNSSYFEYKNAIS